MAGSSLTPRQERFVAEYLCDLNATQAAIRAGYSKKGATVRGTELLANRKVAEAVKAAQVKRAEKLELTAASISEQLIDIADKAKACGSVSGLNVARQAMMDVAKLNGLIVEKQAIDLEGAPIEARSLAFFSGECGLKPGTGT